jgi:hypothetical protein
VLTVVEHPRMKSAGCLTKQPANRPCPFSKYLTDFGETWYSESTLKFVGEFNFIWK